MDDVRKLVNVKPLEWTERYGVGVIKAKASSSFGDYYIDATHQPCDRREDVVVRYACYILGGKSLKGGFYHGKIDGFDAYEQAKAAAQADYEARIYAALTPASDGRAEGLREADVARLVETAQWARNRLEAIADEAWHGDARDFKRALIGVFADFDESLARCGSAMPAILARAAELEGKTDE
jgi:hypothetical protein